MKRTPARKPELALYSVYCLVLAFLGKPYWPTKASAASHQTVVFLVLFLVLILKIIRPGLFERFRRTPLIVRSAVALLCCFLLTGFVVYSHVSGIGFLLIRSFAGGVVVIIAEVLFLICLLLMFKSGKCAWATLRVTFATVLFVNSLLSVLLCYVLWRPPSLKECEENTGGPFVVRITPQKFTDCLSYPNDVYFLPVKDMLAATFKMAGNLAFDAWDKPEANRLVLINVADAKRRQMAVVQLTGPRLPEWMAWNPGKQTLIVTRVGSEIHGISEIDMSGFPDLKVIRDMDIDFEPNGISMDPEYGSFTIFGIQKKITIFDANNFSIIAVRQPSGIPEGVNILDAYQVPGSRKVYLSMLGRNITEYSTDTGETRSADVVFGGGQLVASPQNGLLYQTDILFGALNIVDMKSMKLVKRVRLGYKPRAVEADYERDLLIVGDWFKGSVNLYQLSTLRRIHAPIPVARYMRGFAYDQKRGFLYCACICGVYRLDLQGLLSQKNRQMINEKGSINVNN